MQQSRYVHDLSGEQARRVPFELSDVEQSGGEGAAVLLPPAPLPVLGHGREGFDVCLVRAVANCWRAYGRALGWPHVYQPPCWRSSPVQAQQTSRVIRARGQATGTASVNTRLAYDTGFALSDIPAVPDLWRFPAEPAAVPLARRAVTDALPCGLPSELRADLSLLTSELVTNAVRYGAGPVADEVVELILWPADGHYWLAVSDPGGGKPALKQSGCGKEGGRGLLPVDTLAGAWGVLPASRPRQDGRCRGAPAGCGGRWLMRTVPVGPRP